ncbi:glycosyltransferase family 4 protein [Methylobacterium sp. A54F]
MAEGGPRRVLIIVENLPVPFDRRVWSEATALRRAGYVVSVICPKGRGGEVGYEVLDGVHIYRHPLPVEGDGVRGYAIEYGAALFWEFVLAWRVFFTRGFDCIHACNPPDLIFLVAGFFKLVFRRRFIFDHHDINPELYEAKFGRRDWGWRLMLLLERLTFRTADVSIATNESYRRIAIERGGMDPARVHVVRSGPNLSRVRQVPPDPAWRQGRRHLVGYVGVLGQQEGIDLLLEAVRHLVFTRGRTDVQFVIVGGGPALAALKALSHALDVAPYVTFTGRVSDEVLFSALSSADVCVNPDRPNAMNDKSTMNKIMEYMALAKPIVQFDLTEGRVSAGDASLYAENIRPDDFADKILELLADPQRCVAMGLRGQARVVNDLAWPHEERRLLAAYDDLFGSVGSATQAQALPPRGTAA